MLLRDKLENLPQPGYIGSNYKSTRLLLIGQNPAICPLTKKIKDLIYMTALSCLAKNQTRENYEKLYRILLDFIPEWPVQRNYFPLEECGLNLEDIAYCNVVRCRTVNNRKPNVTLTHNCIKEHLFGFIDLVDPLVIVFIGKWAHDQLSPYLKNKGIPLAYMNRDRSLPGGKRDANRREVIKTVLDVIRKDQ